MAAEMTSTELSPEHLAEQRTRIARLDAIAARQSEIAEEVTKLYDETARLRAECLHYDVTGKSTIETGIYHQCSICGQSW